MKMIQNDLAGKNRALKDWAGMSKMAQKFRGGAQPTEDEIVSLLSSPDRNLQRVALAAMSLKPIETDRLIDVLFGFLDDGDYYFKAYALAALDEFTDFPQSQKPELGRRLLQIVRSRPRDDLMPEEVLLLARFPSQEAAVFLTDILITEGSDRRTQLFRFVAFKTLKQMGDSYYDQAAACADQLCTPQIKEELLDWESVWQDEAPPDDNNALSE
jgi:hypothetical protein